MQKNKKKHIEIDSEIIDFFINHTYNYKEAQIFVLKCMSRLEKLDNEEIIDDSLKLLRICLEDSYNTTGILTTNLDNTDKKICTSILQQEFLMWGE